MKFPTFGAGQTAGRIALRLVVLTAFVLGVLVVSGSTAGAQDDDPYGSTSTTSTSEPDISATCRLQLQGGKANANATVTVTVTNVPFGGTVRILVGGVEAGRATAPAAFQDGFTTLEFPITIPDLDPGKYVVTAVGADFTLRCKVGDGDLLEILSASTDGGSDVLAFTGTNILLMIAAALLLLLLGRRFVKASRRRTS